jgi:hypothetical protein
MLATNDVHYHILKEDSYRIFTASVRSVPSIAGYRLHPNAERYLNLKRDALVRQYLRNW